LLLYADDGGQREFLELSHRAGRVKILFEVVKDGGSPVNITLGRDVNDGRWHRVEIKRNGMQTTLSVDGKFVTSLQADDTFSGW